MKRFFLLMLGALFLISSVLGGVFLISSVLGCNAMRGAGKDISDTGKHIENIGK